jgi:hypothetical protein
VDDTTWLELRLLAPLARRLAQLDPHSPHRPRLEGVAKSAWTTTQLIIRDSASALKTLTDVGIEFLLLKGAANYAEGMAPATRRIMGDVDVLLPPGTMRLATDSLRKIGWSARPKSIEHFNRGLRPSLNFRRAEYGDVDMHQQVFHFSRRNSDLDGDLWNNARLAQLMGIPVRVPSVADSVVISVAHGMRTGDGDWAMDVGWRARMGQIQWTDVAHIAEQRGLARHVWSGLCYLRTLNIEIPEPILKRLSKAHAPLGEHLKYYADTMRRKQVPKKFRKVVDRAANRLLSREKYFYSGSDDAVRP